MNTKGTEAGMFIISQEQIKSLTERVKNSIALDSCVAEIKKMIEIKSTLLWRADAACACVGPGPSNHLYMEVSLLQDVLDALEARDVKKGASLLDDYLRLLL